MYLDKISIAWEDNLILILKKREQTNIPWLNILSFKFTNINLFKDSEKINWKYKSGREKNRTEHVWRLVSSVGVQALHGSKTKQAPFQTDILN